MAEAPVVRIHYIKSNAFRVVHADGVIGGPAPSGLLHASFFSERIPIPTFVEHTITDIGGGRGTLGEEVAREGKKGLVREVEVGIAMTLEMAKQLQVWLGNHIKQMEATLQGNDGNDGAGVPDAK